MIILRSMKRIAFIASGICVSLLVLFQLGRYLHFTAQLEIEVMAVILAIIFAALGVFVSRFLFFKREEVDAGIRLKTQAGSSAAQELGLSKREMEVLDLIVKGLSNQEIAAGLHVSESTVKSHVSNLFVKLDVKRRTQAAKKALELQIITPESATLG